MKNEKITIIGTGYVGLVTGTCLAELGNEVFCIDIDSVRIENLKEGIIPFYEPNLEELVKRNIKEKRLFFSIDLAPAISQSEIIFITVGTPAKENGEADLSYVEKAAQSIAKNLRDYAVIVVKSTVPPKTAKKIEGLIKKYYQGSFDIVSNPEFLREGSAISDFMKPNRIVIGRESKKAEEVIRKLYEPLNSPILVTNLESAEMIKYASNAFLATKISFINEIANICERIGADVEEIAKGMGFDPRIGDKFLKAGLGYGGSCFPKDVRALIHIGEEMGVDFSLLKEVDKINTRRIYIFVNKVKQVLWVLREKKIAVLGLSFKPQTDDIRNAPSIEVIRELKKEGAYLRLYDPQAIANMKKIFPAQDPDLVYCPSAYEALEGANAGLIITEWPEFQNLDLRKVKTIMSNPILIDGRNIFEPAEVRKMGFEYYSIGRK